MPEPSAAESRCPRCGNAFHCGVHDTAPCACAALELDAATLAALRQHYQGCLCVDCLSLLARVGTLARPDPTTPSQPD
jgi:hypothetical protein